jgi:biopolymer transport protein ExbD
MAELNTGDGGGKKGSKKVRSKKQNSKVDLTAMVDLAFLLITFFMLTTTLSKPQSKNLILPAKEPEINAPPPPNIDENTTMTLLLDGNDKVIYYNGLYKEGVTKTADYSKEGIREALITRKKFVDNYVSSSLENSKKQFTVVVKPSKKSNYRNFVDIVDEMAILQIPVYAIVNEFTPEETKLLVVK